jgi:hypothetical protein
MENLETALTTAHKTQAAPLRLQAQEIYLCTNNTP